MDTKLTWTPAAIPGATALVLDKTVGSAWLLTDLLGAGPLTNAPTTAKGPGQEGETALDVPIPPRILIAQALNITDSETTLHAARAAVARAMVNIPVRPSTDLSLGRLLIERTSLSDLEIYATPRSASFSRVKGGYAAVLDAQWFCPYPYFQATSDTTLTVPDTTTLSTSAAADDIIDATDHDLAVGDAVIFDSLTGGTGLTAGTTYYVVAASFAANTFRVGLTAGGAAIDFTTDITAGTARKVSTATNSGDVDAPITAKLYGPATQVTLTNVTTGEAFTVDVALTDVTHWLEVDTSPGAKTIRHYTAVGVYTDAFSGLVLNDARLWALRPGASAVTFAATGSGADTSAVLTWRNRWAGL